MVEVRHSKLQRLLHEEKPSAAIETTEWRSNFPQQITVWERIPSTTSGGKQIFPHIKK